MQSRPPHPSPTPRPTAPNRAPILALAALLAATLLPTACNRSPAEARSSNPPPATVSAAQPVTRVVQEWTEFPGRLAAPETVEVRARVSGFINQVHFREGGEVRQGDLLVSLDPRPFQAAVDRARADLAGARARAELTDGEARRAENLSATRAISTDTLETRIHAAAQAREAVKSAEAALRAAELDLEFTEVRAPISGRVSDARVTPGNLVTGGAGANTTLLTTIVSIDPIHAHFEVDEASALRLRLRGQVRSNTPPSTASTLPAELALADEAGFPHPGIIDFVDNQLQPGTGTLRLRGTFPNPDHRLAPGFFARIRIPDGEASKAVLIRDSAIGNDQGRPFALVLDPSGKITRRTVRLGPVIDGLRVIREGLQGDDLVVVTGLMNTRPGQSPQVERVPMTPPQPATSPIPAPAAAPR